MKLQEKLRIIEVANKTKKADMVLKNATYVNVFTNEMLTGDIALAEGKIVGLGEYSGINELDMTGKIVCPGFIDSHIHLESSLVVPTEFAAAVIPHGTTTVITDPHEIANVMGTDGIDYMLQATEDLPIDIKFMLPSCVPATPLDESGAELLAEDIEKYYSNPRVLGLAEMMNFYGVTHSDKEVVSKIASAEMYRQQIDGHAPGLSGHELNAYVAAGIYSDHECAHVDEAIEKIRLGQHIQIREGTAAKNLEVLAPLLDRGYGNQCMFCTDDKHPSDILEKGHIDYIVKEAINKYKIDPIIAIKSAGYVPAKYYKLNDRGAIAPGYIADLIVIDNFENFKVEKVIKNGKMLYNGESICEEIISNVDADIDNKAHNTFNMSPVTEDSFKSDGELGCIGVLPSSILTKDLGYRTHINTKQDVLKIAVVERHKGTNHIGIGFMQGYGLKKGAIATSISHDSHNIIVIGTNEKDMVHAVNKVLENQGGIVVVENEAVIGEVILEIAGLMSSQGLSEINRCLENAKEEAYKLGVNTNIDPFMSLSFMSLPVIPEIKLTTRGIVTIK